MENDNLHITFLLKNNFDLNSVSYRVAESQFAGADLIRAVEDSVEPNPVITVTSEVIKWQFSLQQQT
jgi:hypothetical protein